MKGVDIIVSRVISSDFNKEQSRCIEIAVIKEFKGSVRRARVARKLFTGEPV